jgi:histidinol phosphatase-like PHP family hydrolase
VIAQDYDTLWTEERMNKVAGAAARNNVAIELNDRYKIPSANFVRVAKAAGCKFTFGTNPSKPAELGRSEYGIRMVQECKLGWQDFFVPGAWGPKAIERKGGALKG